MESASFRVIRASALLCTRVVCGNSEIHFLGPGHRFHQYPVLSDHRTFDRGNNLDEVRAPVALRLIDGVGAVVVFLNESVYKPGVGPVVSDLVPHAPQYTGNTPLRFRVGTIGTKCHRVDYGYAASARAYLFFRITENACESSEPSRGRTRYIPSWPPAARSSASALLRLTLWSHTGPDDA